MEKKMDNFWVGGKDLTHDQDFIANSQQEVHPKASSTLENLGEEGVAESIGGNRRDFLKFLGFGLGAATIAAGCDIPVRRALPYVVKPDDIVPGLATYFASAIVTGGEYCPVLVKTREGRPIKIEGNDLSKMTSGGTSARAQASVLSLYSLDRYTMPQINVDGLFKKATWKAIDNRVSKALASASNVRVVSNTILSPTLKNAITEFTSKYGGKLVTYDPVSSSAALDANEKNFGVRALPGLAFDKADVVVSFDADFLGTWVSPVEYQNKYMMRRKMHDVKSAQNTSRLIVVEAGMSLTGSNADNRILVKPSEQGAAIAYLASKIVGGVSVPALNAKAKKALDKTAAHLMSAKGKSIVISASNNVAEQELINAINASLGNIGNTVDYGDVSYQRQGSDSEMRQLIADVKAGRVDTIIFNECNPVYDHPQGAELKAAMAKTKMSIALCGSPNETSAACTLIAPVHHNLESWGDARPKASEYAVIQPTIKNLFDTRQAGHSFLVWADSANLNKTAKQPYYEYLKSQTKAGAFSGQSEYVLFSSFWDGWLHDGVASSKVSGGAASFSGSAASAAAGISKPLAGDIEIEFKESLQVGNGVYANNPWLQEMPDPVKRTSWGNYLAIPVSFDGGRRMIGMNGLEDGDLVDVTIGDKTITVPVVQQFGQTPGTVSLALGYGREVVGKAGAGIGANVYDCLSSKNGVEYYTNKVSVGNSKGKEKYYSSVQYHHTYGVTGNDAKTGEVKNADEAALVFFDYFTGVEGFQGALTDRSVVYTSNVKDLAEKVEHMHHKREHAQHLNDAQIYKGHDDLYKMGHHWGMHVDLNSCTGCGACVVACMAENNIPVVGKKEVSRHHEMTWLRIDRYFYGDVNNPNAVYQPMMCQHCDNAPCENVCPVNATNHSSEGLNQMAYPRCVGTRYCANNCPYKVRRFNWLDYTTADLFPGNQPSINGEDPAFGTNDLTRMVLNPDVTVRVRGVIEKCSFCVQRIQEGKLTAKLEGRRLRDSDVRPACQTSCPTGGITFGDMNNKGGELDTKLQSPLNYIALEEVNVRSSVTYTMKVNNRDESMDA